MADDIEEGGRQFVKVYFDFIDSMAFNKLSGNALKLYLRMRRYVCRARSGHSLSDFYIKGFLAVSGYLSQYATAFGVSKSSISRWLKELEDAKFIVTYYSSEYKSESPNIWIFGRVSHIEGSNYGVEVFFMDHDAMAQEPDVQAAQVFDQSKGDAICANMSVTEGITETLTVAQVQRSVQRCVQHSNREDLIEKNNILPPPEKAEDKPSVEEVRARLLKSTKTKGEDDPIQQSALAEYIGQQLNSPVPAGGCNKLARGYTEQLPGGKHKRHPPPDQLWLEHPLFPEWVDLRIRFIRGKGGSNAAQRSKAVNAICQYKGSSFAWLEWLATQAVTPRFKTIEEVEAERHRKEPMVAPPLPPGFSAPLAEEQMRQELERQRKEA